MFRHPSDPPATHLDVRACGDAAETLLNVLHGAWSGCTSIAWGPDAYRTEFRALWTREALVVRFDCDDDEPWWTLTKRDDHLWNEEVVEVFLDPARAGRSYAEVEINPANVVCNLRVATPWPELSSDTGWDWPGLQSRVTRRTAGQGRCRWTAIASMPFEGARGLSDDAARRIPPSVGDRWHFNVFRIKRPGGSSAPERNAVYAAWSVPDGPSFHAVDRFRDLIFRGLSRTVAGDSPCSRHRSRPVAGAPPVNRRGARASGVPQSGGRSAADRAGARRRGRPRRHRDGHTPARGPRTPGILVAEGSVEEGEVNRRHVA